MKASNLNNLLEVFKDSYGFYNLAVQLDHKCPSCRGIDKVFWRVCGDLYGPDSYTDIDGNQFTKYFYGDGETIEEAFNNLETKLVRILRAGKS